MTATATPAAIGRRSQVWEIRIVDDAGKLACISRCTLAVIEQRSTYATAERARSDMTRTAVIVDVVRTPSGRGKPGGALSRRAPRRPRRRRARRVLERNGLDPGRSTTCSSAASARSATRR